MKMAISSCSKNRIARWNRPQIDEALALVEEALSGAPGPFALEAAIAAEHCKAAASGGHQLVQIVKPLRSASRTNAFSGRRR